MLEVKQRNKYERIIWWTIICTIPLWLIGGIYIVGSILGWALCIIKLCETRHIAKQNTFQTNIVILSWLIGALILLISLLIGHYNYELGVITTVKSSIGWAKGWALFPLYIVSGFLPVRKQIIIRSIALNSIIMLAILVIGVLVFFLGVEGSIYTSPLRIVSPGNSDSFFDFTLLYRDLATNSIKVRLFAPWSPALGLLANTYFWIIINESDRKIRNIAIISIIVLCVVSNSRAALISITIIPTIMYLLKKIKGYLIFYISSLLTAIVSIYYDLIVRFASDSWLLIRNSRSDSSRIRSLLTQISLQRWIDEAFWWGHGIVIQGPKLVENILVGTHNTWVHLLYAKGLIGLIAFLLPMVILLLLSFMNFLRNNKNLLSTSCLGIVLVLWQYTISENLEMLAYLYWPSLLFVGIVFASNDSGKISAKEFKEGCKQ